MTMLSEQERAWWRDRLDAWLDNELDATETARFEALARMDPLLFDELAVMQRLQRELRSERVPLCPDRVVDTVMAHVRRDLRRSWSTRLAALVPRTVLWRPVLATAVLIGVVVTAALSGRTITQPSVATASADVKWALAYISAVGNDTAESVRTEAFEPIVNSLVEN